MTKHIYLRALGISTLKTIAYIILILAGLFFVAESISPFLFVIIFHFIYFLNTFLFAEWIFEDVHIRMRQLLIIIVSTFLLELIISLAFFTMFLRISYFDFTLIYKNLIFFALHAGAMFAALYVRRRFWAKEGLAEGLES